MSEVIFFVKTQSFANDRRVHKEIELSQSSGKTVTVYFASDSTTNLEDFNFTCKEIKIFGGAAPKSLIKRLFGAIHFSLIAFWNALMFDKKTKFWVADPILFPLVFFLNISNRSVIWDHHELPPTWLFNSKFLIRRLFGYVYSNTDVIIHANKQRQLKLEEWLGSRAKCSYILRNLPSKEVVTDPRENRKVSEWLNGRPFVYLQNSFIYERCGSEIVEALLDLGFCIVHAGSSVDYDYMQENGINLNDLEDRILLLGNIALKEIDFLLKKAALTVIFYRQTSLNQTFCEPNRIYHAMANNVKIIAGDNPTIKDILQGYENCIVVSEFSELKGEVETLASKKVVRRSTCEFWENYGDTIEAILRK